jgi:phosphopantetheinyl transferase (holo-ACP synthase)
MSSDFNFERVVLEGGELPLVILLTDAEPTRLEERARELCDDRWPNWSRSYSGVIALVAGWHQRVGVDVEFLHRASDTSWSIDDMSFRSAMMTPEEREHLPMLDDDPGASAVNLWCSKEALAKALGTTRGMDPARLTGAAMWDHLRRGAWRATFLDLLTLEYDAIGWLVYESRWP